MSAPLPTEPDVIERVEPTFTVVIAPEVPQPNHDGRLPIAPVQARNALAQLARLRQSISNERASQPQPSTPSTSYTSHVLTSRCAPLEQKQSR